MVLLGGRGGDYRALIHAEDSRLVAPYHWYVHKSGRRSKTFYAVRSWNYRGKRHTQAMHTLIAGFGETDHINGEGLDNRRCNLREADRSQNNCNKSMRSDNTSGFKGVWLTHNGRYRAQVTGRGLVTSLGTFDFPVDAARAYDKGAQEVHGEFAITNKMLGLL